MEQNYTEITDTTALWSNPEPLQSLNTPLEQPEKDVSRYWQIGQKLGTCMFHLYTNNLWTDVTFRCKDHVEDDKADRIRAHKIVLAARSPFFNEMFYGSCAKISEGEVNLITTEAAILDLLIRFIYSDETSLTGDTAPRVLKLAHMYQIPNLVEYCADFLASAIRVDNACEILELALVYNQNKLRDDACVFIDNHAKQVLDSDSFLQISNACLTYILKGDTLFENEGYIFKRAMDWAESKLSGTGETVDGQKKRKVLGEAFYYLRVPTLGNLEFIKCTKGEGFYTMQEMENIIECINDKSIDSSLCHSVAIRAPQELVVHVPYVEQSNSKPTNRLEEEKEHVDKIHCTVLVSVSNNCFMHSVSLQNVLSPYLSTIQSKRSGLVIYKKDSICDVTLDCILCIDEIQFKTEFQMKRGELGPIMLEKPVQFEKKDTPYSLKFELKYKNEQSLIYLEAFVNSKYRDRCGGSSHSEACLNKLGESPSVAGLKASYCNRSKHLNCIGSLGVKFLPSRGNDKKGCEENLAAEGSKIANKDFPQKL